MLIKIVFGKEAHVMKQKQTDTYKVVRQFISQVFKKLPQSYTLSYQDEDGDRISLMNETDFQNLKTSQLAKVKIEIEADDCLNQHFQELLFENDKKISSQHHQIFKMEPKIQEQSVKQKIQSDQIPLKEKKKLDIRELQGNSLYQEQKSFSKYLPLNNIQDNKKPKSANFQHEDIICDNCRICPIIGNRYKCIKCQDYDLCEQCEAKNLHPHSFWKIKYPQDDPQKVLCNWKGQKKIIDKYKYFDDLGVWVEGLNIDEKVNKTKNALNSAKNVTTEKIKSISGEIMKYFVKAENKQYYIDLHNDAKKKQKQRPKIQQQRERTAEDRTIEAASYLSAILGKDFTSCYKFAKQFESSGLDKEQILVQYFDKPEKL